MDSVLKQNISEIFTMCFLNLFCQFTCIEGMSVKAFNSAFSVGKLTSNASTEFHIFQEFPRAIYANITNYISIISKSAHQEEIYLSWTSKNFHLHHSNISIIYHIFLCHSLLLSKWILLKKMIFFRYRILCFFLFAREKYNLLSIHINVLILLISVHPIKISLVNIS